MLARGEMDEAVQLYESCMENVGDLMMGELPAASSKLQRALANLFYRARDYKRAAAACEQLGELEAAARAYESAYAYDRAAACYARMNEPKKAAAVYVKAGNFMKAAELYTATKDYAEAAAAMESAGDNLGAAQLFLRLNDQRRAAQALAKVQPGEPKFVASLILLGEVLNGMGRRDLAIQRMATGMPRDGLIRDPVTAELAYRLALLLAEAGDGPRATRVFELLRAMSPPYKDSVARLAAAQSLPAGAAPIHVTGGMAAVSVPPQGSPRIAGASSQVSTVPATPGSHLPPPLSSGVGVPPVNDPFASLDGAIGDKSVPPQEAARPMAGQFITRMEGYELLKTLPIFEDLSLDEMKDFYNLCEPVIYDAGAVIIEQGRPGEALVIVRQGSLRVTKLEGGKETTLATLPAGRFVGEMSLVDDAPTSARVVAAEKVKAFRIRKEAFVGYLFTHDLVALRIYRSFTRTLVQRLRETNAKLSAR
jgi:tetratricopeptide (TPR) repeat protein